MIVKSILVVIFVIIAAISKAVQDKIQYHFYESKFKKMSDFWNPEKSWKFKYKDGDPKKGDRFLGSSTFFVGFTDAWHLFGLIRNVSLFSSIVCASGLWWMIFTYPIFTGTFTLFYKVIFSSKEV